MALPRSLGRQRAIMVTFAAQSRPAERSLKLKIIDPLFVWGWLCPELRAFTEPDVRRWVFRAAVRQLNREEGLLGKQIVSAAAVYFTGLMLFFLIFLRTRLLNPLLPRALYMGCVALLATSMHLVWLVALRGSLRSALRHEALELDMQLCAKCGYDVTASTSLVCSECGTPFVRLVKLPDGAVAHTPAES